MLAVPPAIRARSFMTIKLPRKAGTPAVSDRIWPKTPLRRSGRNGTPGQSAAGTRLEDRIRRKLNCCKQGVTRSLWSIREKNTTLNDPAGRPGASSNPVSTQIFPKGGDLPRRHIRRGDDSAARTLVSKRSRALCQEGRKHFFGIVKRRDQKSRRWIFLNPITRSEKSATFQGHGEARSEIAPLVPPPCGECGRETAGWGLLSGAQP
jgi:hypothetical protein